MLCLVIRLQHYKLVHRRHIGSILSCCHIVQIVMTDEYLVSNYFDTLTRDWACDSVCFHHKYQYLWVCWYFACYSLLTVWYGTTALLSRAQKPVWSVAWVNIWKKRTLIVNSLFTKIVIPLEMELINELASDKRGLGGQCPDCCRCFS